MFWLFNEHDLNHVGMSTYIRKWGSLLRMSYLGLHGRGIFLRGNRDGGESPPDKGLGTGTGTPLQTIYKSNFCMYIFKYFIYLFICLFTQCV